MQLSTCLPGVEQHRMEAQGGVQQRDIVGSIQGDSKLWQRVGRQYGVSQTLCYRG